VWRPPSNTQRPQDATHVTDPQEACRKCGGNGHWARVCRNQRLLFCWICDLSRRGEPPLTGKLIEEEQQLSTAVTIGGNSYKATIGTEWAERPLKAVREGQVGHPGGTDFGPRVERSSGRAQKGNNGSRRPYIRPQSAGSWISRSRRVKPSRSVKVPRELQPSESSEAAPWEAHKEQDRHVETFGIGTSEISELRHRSLSSGKVPTLSRPHPGESPGGSVRDKQKSPTTKNRKLGEESCLRPSVPCPTKQELA